MNDIASLAAQLRQLSADLPHGSLRNAADHLQTGHVSLAEAGRDSVEPIGLGHLHLSRDKLDSALRHLDTAATSIDEYLAAIGANGKASASAPSSAPAAVFPAGGGDADGHQWWIDAINALCEREGKPDSGAATTSPTSVFSQLARLATSGDAAGYHRTLLDIGPTTGVKLPGLSWPMIRSLASETLGRQPTKQDTQALRESTFSRVRSVLPGVDERSAEEQLASACAVAVRNTEEDQQSRARAAEAAALGPVLVASLHQQRESA